MSKPKMYGQNKAYVPNNRRDGMTRKKFIKRCMSLGHSRNKANEFSEQVRRLEAPYKVIFDPTVGFSKEELAWKD